jgi:sugar O-acyltransferase (sialic acid O-acetyltransferase NeuD family)
MQNQAGKSIPMKDIVLFGTSGHAKVVADIVEQEGLYKIVGLIDPNQPSGVEFFGYKTLGSDDELLPLIKKHQVEGGIIGVGDNWVRYLTAQNILNLIPDFYFIKAVHPAAQIASRVTLKRGAVVAAGAVINSGSEIGEFCLINTQSSVDHDNIFEDYSSIMVNAATGGNVRAGAFSVLGMGASILPNVQIGTHTVIGAGSVVLKSVGDCLVVTGSPAEVKKTRRKGDAYL